MSDDCVGPALKQCPVCGAIGLPERIAVHECAAFKIHAQSHVSSTEDEHTSEYEFAHVDSPAGEPSDRALQYPEEKP